MFHAMQRQDVVPNVITYSALISACEKGKQPETTMAMFYAIQRQDVVPDIMTYGALISTCQRGKQPNQAVQMCHAVQRHGVERLVGERVKANET